MRSFRRCGSGSIGTATGSVVAECYAFDFEQPVDHGDPQSVTFLQHVQVTSFSEAEPVVLVTSGYDGDGADGFLETVPLNHVTVSHRFYGASAPKVLDWTRLTIAESAADLHAVVTELKTIYRGRWLSTGVSKGGETALFYRRFYPDDVDATVANVAPNVHGLADPRFPAFLASVGGDGYAACRTSLLELQRALLSRRDEILPQLQGAFETLGKDVALEHMVLELPFDFWAFADADDPTRGCPAVPPADASASALFRFLDQVVHPSTFGDGALEALLPYAYEASTQLGYFTVDEGPLSDLLQHGDTYRIATYAPRGVPLAFDAQAMLDIQTWVSTQGRSLILIYGERDPWSAAMLDLGAAQDSYRFVQKKGGHTSRLWGLEAGDQTMALAAINRWLGSNIRLH